MGKLDTGSTHNTKQLVVLGVIITLLIAVLIFTSSSGGSADTAEPTEAEKLPAVEKIDTKFDLDAIEAVDKRDLFDSTIQPVKGDGNLFDGI